MADPLLSFFGDDFTGSTDALELLSLAGLRTRLFTRVPPEAELSGLDAYGVAGETRAMTADDLERTLRDVLSRMAKLPARLVHYKVCSTFDSSPQVGSIGRAIDAGFDAFHPAYVPVVAAAPSLGRYCAFGNLFARFGGDGEVFRLDRHPSVSRHPVTPMTEADLTLHLAQQTSRPIKLLDFRHYEASHADALAEMQRHRDAVVLCDLLSEGDLPRLGQLLDQSATARFLVGSSGVESALLAWWRADGTFKCAPAPSSPPVLNTPLLVLCGSCSPVSIAQVKWATERGFAQVVVEANAPRSASEAIAYLREGRHVIVHTAGDRERTDADRTAIARALAEAGRAIVDAMPIHRVVVAGGDTSGAVARAMKIDSFEMLAPLVRGAPVVRAAASGSPAEGVEFVFKGGQVGNASFFGTAAGVERGDGK